MQKKYHNILVTGGAGFIGSFLIDKLIEQGYSVRILDNLEQQVHKQKLPSYLNKKAEFIHGDVRDKDMLDQALEKIDVVFHLAARVGVAQSNYQIHDYVESNIGGMANLLDLVVNKRKNIKKIIMTSSMTSYGEGNYQCEHCGVVKPNLRVVSQLQKKDWLIYCPVCGGKTTPIATTEEAAITNNSIYSLSKRVQEEMLLLVGKMYNIPSVALRCFNVYGPRQSLSNPYTGVTAIFISRLKNGNQPVVYEDGLQSRDFVSVHDVVTALIAAMQSEKANYQSINIGSGNPIAIKDAAVILSQLLGKNISPHISGEFRINDIRHCFADITKAKKLLLWSPTVDFEKGMRELIDWAKEETAVDLYDTAEKELRIKNLL